MCDEWYVYLVKCNDNTLYCGITIDIARRVEEHNNSSRGAKYTHSRRPVELVYNEGPYSKQIALRREFVIKGMSRINKLALTNSTH